MPTQLRLILCDLMDCSLRGSSDHGITRVGCHFLLQEIFPTQGLNPVSCIGRRALTTEPPKKPEINVLEGKLSVARLACLISSKPTHLMHPYPSFPDNVS